MSRTVSVCSLYYCNITFLSLILFTSGLVTSVYKKLLSVNTVELSQFSSGETVNFMSTDVDRVSFSRPLVSIYAFSDKITFVARCPAAKPTHRQLTVLAEHTRWSFLLDRASRSKALGRGDSRLIVWEKCVESPSWLFAGSFMFALFHPT